MNRKFSTTVLCLTLWIAAVSAQGADRGLSGWGPRFGVATSPDQLHFGIHIGAGNIARQIRFQPNFEMGVGDNRTLTAFNFDLHYLFGNSPAAWRPYLGGGLSVNYLKTESRFFRDRSDTDLGASVLGGLETNVAGANRFFMEMKVAIIDVPDLKLSFGWIFGR